MTPRTEKILLYAFLPLGIILMTWLVFGSAQYDSWREASEARDQARQQTQTYREPYRVSAAEQAAVTKALPAAPDAQSTLRWIEETAAASDGAVSDFRSTASSGAGSQFIMLVTVPQQNAATMMAQLLRGVRPDVMLPLARPASPNARLVRISSIELTKSQTGSASIRLGVVASTS